MLRACVLVSALVGAGCGPVEYVGSVTRRASRAVEQAGAEDAARLAPYEYTRAQEYLVQARREAAAADFQAANRFGRLSEEAALAAITQAKAVAADPSLGPLSPPVPSAGKAAPSEAGNAGRPTAAPSAVGDDRENPLAPTEGR